jgi:antirestriction protein ArdC
MANKVHEIVTEKILAELNKGSIPWRKPWNCAGPKNLVSKKEYRGINPFLLDIQGFKSPWWVTFNQAKELGGNVKKGEKSTLVVFWKMLKGEKENADGTKSPKTFALLRYYNVFNVEQCEGLEKRIPADVKREHKPIAEAEAVVNEYADKPEIKHGGDQACYCPMSDNIRMPHAENFQDGEGYYSTLFHELAHSTGSEKRLHRKDFLGFFESKAEYAKEELVAEMTSAFLASECGFTSVEQPKNVAAYIQSWLKSLQNNPEMVVCAASAAQKAADYIRGRNKKQEEVADDKEEAKQEEATAAA